MKPAILIIAIIASLAAIAFADNEVITTFKDPTISCDYLIVAPVAFQTPAVMLAQHRNAFKNDDVEQAKVAFLEDIITAFPGTDYNHRNVALWNALKWAKQNWRMSFKYLVLIGTDAFEIGTDSIMYSDGLMPTWYALGNLAPDMNYQGQDCPVAVSDDCYTRLSYATPTAADNWSGINDTGFCIGRIPTQTPELCSLYVEKVKRFDLSRPKGAWRNSMMAIADNAMLGANPSPLGSVFQEADEIVVDSSLQGYLVRKRYLSAYPFDEFYEQPLATAAIIATINQGVALAFFSVYGSDQQLGCGNVLNSDNTNLFTNDSMPFVLVAFTSRNGSIFSAVPVPMSQKFLFMPQGGAIAYIGSASETYASDNEWLGRAFFSQLKQNPGASLGALLAKAKSIAPSYNNQTYFFLGDPALRATYGTINVSAAAVPDSAPTAVRITVPGDSTSHISYSVSFTVRDSVPAFSGQYNMGFSFDSTIAMQSGVFQHSVDVPLPQAPLAAQKAIVYVWNDSVDGRAAITVGAGPGNAVSRKLAGKEIPGKPMLSKIRGSIVLANLQQGINEIRIFDIRGRIVYSGESGPNLRSVTINLADRNICSGRYILQLRNQTTQTVLPFVHLAGE